MTLAVRDSMKGKMEPGDVRAYRGFLIARFPDRNMLDYRGEPTGHWLGQYFTIPATPCHHGWGYTRAQLAANAIGVHIAHRERYGTNCPHRMPRLGEMVRVG